MPVSLKSSSVVSKVRLAAGRWPRAASTASAVDRIVPPTQKPSTLIWSCAEISRTTRMASIAPPSM